MARILVPAFTVVGGIALTAWLERAGFSQDALMLVWVTCGLVVLVDVIGRPRLVSFYRLRRGLALGYVVIVALGYVAIGYRIYVNPADTTTPFSAVLQVVYSSKHSNQGTRYWVLPGGDKATSRAPANAAVYLRLINMQTVPSFLDSVIIELEGEDGGWVRLQLLQTLRADVYHENDDGDFVIVNDQMTEFIDRRLYATHLGPRGFLVGWMLLRYPPAFVPRQPVALRLTVSDVAGSRAVIVPDAPKRSDSVHVAVIVMGMKNRRDVSSLPIMPFFIMP